LFGSDAREGFEWYNCQTQMQGESLNPTVCGVQIRASEVLCEMLFALCTGRVIQTRPWSIACLSP